MSYAVFPTFKEIFPDLEAPSLDDILRSTPSIALLRVAAYLNSQVHISQFDTESQEKIFKRWIKVFDIATTKKIWLNYIIFKSRIEENGFRVSIFTSITLLPLMQRILHTYNELPMPVEASKEAEIAFLQALLVNSSQTGRYIREGSLKNKNDLFKMALLGQAKQYEFVERKDIFSLILISNALFEHLNSDVVTKPHLTDFLQQKNLDSYQAYLRGVAEIYLQEAGKTFFFQLGDQNSYLRSLFDEMSLPISELPSSISQFRQNDEDFKLFRKYPIVRSSDDQYYILHHNFFIDKLYQSVVFEIYRETSLKNVFKKFDSFLQWLGNFAEEKLFYGFVHGCFRSGKYVISVEGNKHSNIEYSDFYLRIGNAVFLFEFKNSIIKAEIKHSYDYEAVKSEIEEKLVVSSDGKPKGVTQLINVIKKLLGGPFLFDDYIAKKIGRLQIYPIIVHTDDFFNIDGVEKIIDDEFRAQMTKMNVSRHNVKPIVLMHLNDLIELQLSSTSDSSHFRMVLDTYLKRRMKFRRKQSRNMHEDLKLYRCFRNVISDLFPENNSAIVDKLVRALDIQESNNSL